MAASAAEAKTAKKRAWCSQRKGFVSTMPNWTSTPSAKFARNRVTAA
jgi:hypothetical protein